MEKAPRGSGSSHVAAVERREAEVLLFAEMGPEVMQALRPHLTALMSIADLNRMNPLIRPFLRFVGEIHTRLSVAEATIHRWRTQCQAAEAQLEESRAEVQALRAWLQQERDGSDSLKAEVAQAVRASEGLVHEHRLAEERLSEELRQNQTQVMRLGQQGMKQTQSLAQEQAAKTAWAHEINRLRVELEVTGSMGRQPRQLGLTRLTGCVLSSRSQA